MTAMSRVASTATPEMRDRVESTSTAARSNLAARAHGTADLRELGLMLGLFGQAPDGSLRAATPWDPGGQVIPES